jgi:hypothetical protein
MLILRTLLHGPAHGHQIGKHIQSTTNDFLQMQRCIAWTEEAGSSRSGDCARPKSGVDAVTHKYRFGRTMGAGIGLYTNRVGYWLWGFGDSPKDRYELWRID